jgi:acyl carrier protein
MDNLESKVLEIIAQQKRVPVENVTVNSSFDELGMDSLDAVNVLFELEGAFDINISDEKARQIKSVREMVEGVRALVAEKKPA